MRGTGPRGRRSPAEVVASELVLRCAVLWKKLKVQPAGRKSGCGRAEGHPTGSSRRVISPRRNVCVYSMYKEWEEKLQGRGGGREREREKEKDQMNRQLL
jgi:hypothetical protein